MCLFCGSTFPCLITWEKGRGDQLPIFSVFCQPHPFIILCVQFFKNILKYLSSRIPHIFGASNQPVSFVELENVDLKTKEKQLHRAYEQRKSKQKQYQVTFKLAKRSIVRFIPQTIQWYHQRMASLSDVRVKRKISCQ